MPLGIAADADEPQSLDCAELLVVRSASSATVAF
jgi:hypothetical protein